MSKQYDKKFKEDAARYYFEHKELGLNISAPGGDISKKFDINEFCLTTTINSRYTYTFGTYIAAPKVSAVVALIICKNPDFTQKEIAKKSIKLLIN